MRRTLRGKWQLLFLLLVVIVVLGGSAALAAWDKTKPAGTTLVSQADDYIRDNWAALEGTVGVSGIGNEHVFTASDQTCKHREGSARITIDVAGNQGSANTEEGRTFYETDTTRLEYADDADTWQLLSPKRNTARCSWISGAADSYDGLAWNSLSANLTCDITTVATTNAAIFISATFTLEHVVANDTAWFCIAVDGTNVTDAANGMGMLQENDQELVTVTLSRLVLDGDNSIDLSAGSHTITIQAKLNDAGAQVRFADTVAHSIFIEEL
jgi:hypothetical protein